MLEQIDEFIFELIQKDKSAIELDKPLYPSEIKALASLIEARTKLYQSSKE